MNARSIRTMAAASSLAGCSAILLLLCAALVAVPASRASGIEPAVVEPSKPDPAAPRVSADRSGEFPTKDGLTLRLTTDLGSVKIVPLEPGAAAVVRYPG